MSSTYMGPVYATNPQNKGGIITNSTGVGSVGSDTNGIAIYTAGVNGSRVYSLLFSTSDTSANNVFLYVLSGANIYPIGQINVPANSGDNVTSGSTVSVDGISSTNCPGLPFDGTGKPYIELGPNAALKFSVVAAVTSGKTLYASAMGADY